MYFFVEKPKVPKIQPSISFTNITKTSMSVNISLNNIENSHIVIFCRETYAIPTFKLEDINGKVFNGNSVFKTGDFFKNSYCVYSGIPKNITVTGLSKYTICYFSAFVYNPNNNQYCIEKQVGNVRSRWTLR